MFEIDSNSTMEFSSFATEKSQIGNTFGETYAWVYWN